jgi:ABC-type enterochelin transport system permease subunit
METEKRENLEVGIMLIILSLIFICGYLTTKELTIAIASAMIGATGLFFLCLSGKINKERTVLSIITIMFGGIVIPLLPLVKDFATPLIALFYAIAILLLILKPPERWNVKAPAHQ